MESVDNLDIREDENLTSEAEIVYQSTPEEFKSNEEPKAKYLGVTG